MDRADFWARSALAVLATWRVTHLLSREDGPADLIVQIRARLGQSLAGKLMDCFYCLSLWVAAPAALFVTTKPLDWLVVCLALSGAACLLERTKQDPLVIQPLPPNAEGDTDYGMLRTETSGARERPAGGGSAAASGPGESAGPASGPANSSHLPTASPTNGHGLDNGASLH